MEAAAKKFEQEGVLDEFNQEADCGVDLYALYSFPSSNMLHDVDDGYSPYCEISIELNPERYEKTQDQSTRLEYSCCKQPTLSHGTEDIRSELAEASLSFAASSLCSFASESSCMANNVRPAP